MTSIVSLKADLLVARKAKDETAKNLLTALVGEAVNVGKNQGNRETTDEEVTQLVKKFIKNAEETRRISLDNNRNADVVEKELEILSKYVPVQMTQSSIIAVLQQFKQNNAQAKLGDAMKYMKENFAGIYDAKMASTIAKDVFK